MAQEISDGIIAFLHLRGILVQINSRSLETERCCYPVTPSWLFEIFFFVSIPFLVARELSPISLSYSELTLVSCP